MSSSSFLHRLLLLRRNPFELTREEKRDVIGSKKAREGFLSFHFFRGKARVVRMVFATTQSSKAENGAEFSFSLSVLPCWQ